MAELAFVFSGQGAQFPGMGLDLYQTSAAAKRVFDLCDGIRNGTINQCFYGSKEELSLTVNTQPCMFAVSLAAAEAFKEQGFLPCALAGFSVGEIPALTFAGVFSFEDGFNVVCKRAQLMQTAAQNTKGAMAAILKLTEEKVVELCRETQVYPVNFNCTGQTVVAGESGKMAAFYAVVAQNGGRAMPLSVSGAFHSPYMDQAAAGLLEYLKTIKVNPPRIPVYANKTAMPYDPDCIRETLAAQVNSPVLWQKSIQNMLTNGITEFNETGPGNVLTNLINKIKGV